MTTQESFPGEHLLNNATETLRNQRQGAGKLLSTGRPIEVQFTHTQAGITHDLTLSLRKKKRVITPAVPTFMPLTTTPPSNAYTQKKRERNGAVAIWLLPLLMFLLLATGIIASNLPSGVPASTKHASIHMQQTAVPTQLCSQTELELSTIFGAPTTVYPSPYAQCALHMVGNFTVPTSYQLMQQLIIPPTAMSAIIQRGFGGLYPQRAEVLEITNVHPGEYNDIVLASEKGVKKPVRASIILINPILSIDDLKLLCPRLMATYANLIPKGDTLPSGCYLYPDDH